MTFAQLVVVVSDYCNLTSTEAQTRIGKSINRHYRRITSELGLDATRFVTRSVAMTVGVRTVTFTEIEKIDRIIDMTDGTSLRVLTEVSQHTQRTTQPGASYPSTWSLQNTDADSVTVLTDTVPDAAYSLQADGRVTLSDLSGSDEPVFPESYHDILSWYVISEELLKKEKDKLARIYESKADKLLSELRFFLADSPTLSVRPRDTAASTLTGSGGGGGTVPVAAGSDTNIQYNDSGVLAGDAGLSYDTLLGGNGVVVASAVYPYLQLTDTAQAADSKSMRLVGAGGYLTIEPIDDAIPAGGVGATVQVRRDGRVALNSGQLTFPAVHNPSSDPNTLDDYEEGTFAPTLTGASGGSGQAYTTQLGSYVKIGQVVHVTVEVLLSTLGTVTGPVTVGNLPFSTDSHFSTAHVGFWSGLTSSMCYVGGYIPPSSNAINLYGTTAAATALSALVQGDLSNTSRFILSGSYRAAS